MREGISCCFSITSALSLKIVELGSDSPTSFGITLTIFLKFNCNYVFWNGFKLNFVITTVLQQFFGADNFSAAFGQLSKTSVFLMTFYGVLFFLLTYL